MENLVVLTDEPLVQLVENDPIVVTPGTIYWAGASEFIGRMPIRAECTVIPERPSKTIGWSMTEVIGQSVINRAALGKLTLDPSFPLFEDEAPWIFPGAIIKARFDPRTSTTDVYVTSPDSNRDLGNVELGTVVEDGAFTWTDVRHQTLDERLVRAQRPETLAAIERAKKLHIAADVMSA